MCLINVLKSYVIGEEISAGKGRILGLTRIKPIQTNIDCQIVHEEPVILVGPTMDEDNTSMMKRPYYKNIG